MGIDWFKNLKSSEDLEAHENESHDFELERLRKQHGVIARILNARIENEGLEEYRRILDNEFLEFASGVDSLKEKEIALLTLQEIKKELQLVASYPSLFQKSMVAVGGGFSAGKSSFLNHLLGLNLKLPENLTPTTAIPTYCLKGEREVLMGRSQNGGMVELPHLTFDHQFLESLGFNLKEIMPFMLLSAPSVPFEFLCFIDTPGYNPSNQGYTGGDRQASEEYLNHAKHILWLISCEHGGIEKSDLDYLQELYEESKQVFIVLSRADSRTKKQLEEEIAVQIKETLEDNGIEFLGIVAYSTTRYQEIKEFSEKSSVFDSLEKFLMELNKRSEKQNEILSVLYNVHLAYEKAIQQDADQFKRYQDALHSIKLDLVEKKGGDDSNDAAFSRIESLKKEFSEQERSKRGNLEQLNQVINLFKKSIDKVFDRVSAFTWEKYKEKNDEENYQEFEEIKKMVLYFRDCWMFVAEQLDGKSSQEELQKYRGFVNYNNELLQLEFSLENLLTLREYRATHEEDYQADLNNSGLQKDLQKWKSKTKPMGKKVIKFREIKAMILECRDFYERYMEDRIAELNPKAFSRCKEQVDECNDLLRLDYSSKNLKRLKQFKNDVYNKTYQEDLQKKWRRSKR
ncbi:dynamin family protein [Helicobacter pylori]|uniref:dynamin family protein n=1 Tax=Helicobacter pylori TaxID=210 RepID=UPI000FDE3B60|nr:dynamin-like GTPase family protein [Helicobacter pylori]RVZ78687.1 ATPase [Helicobacter pylori]